MKRLLGQSVLTSNCGRSPLSVSIFVALSLIVVVSDLSAVDWFTNKLSSSDWSIVVVLLVFDWLFSAKLVSDWFNWEDKRCQLSRSTNGCVICGSEKEEDCLILIYITLFFVRRKSTKELSNLKPCT
mgnify:CR=1 FL=1